jgi:hypothetical protein
VLKRLMKISVLAQLLVMAAAAVHLGPTTVHAQNFNLFESLFGERVLPPSPPAATTLAPSARQGLRITVTPRPAAPVAYAYCVRLCDGRYFPLPRLASPRMMAATLCRSLCPGAQTALYWGSSIESATNAQRVRYSKLRTAFQYRKSMVTDCTCNGTDALGTAAISIYQDVTLSPGDIVVTSEGLKVFAGSRGPVHSPDQFISLDAHTGISHRDREQLSGLQVAPAATTVPAYLDPIPIPIPLTITARIVIGFEAMNAPVAPPRVIGLER